MMKKKIAGSFIFIADKLRHFKDLTLGEQLSYSSIGVGTFLVIVSFVLFIIWI